MSTDPQPHRQTKARSSLHELSAAAAVALAGMSAVALDPGGWFPFSIAKWASVLAVALVAGACVAFDGGLVVERRSFALWAVLLVLVTLSALVGLEGRMAWFGTPVRHLGVLTWFVFALLFGVGTHVGPHRLFLRGMMIVGAVLGIYAAWEIVIGAPVAYVTDSSRAGGPYGSSAYLGAACCLFLPIAFGVAASRSEDRTWRVGAAVATALLIAATIGSGTRGALVALLFTAMVVAACRFRSWPQRRYVAIGIGVIGVVLGVVVATTERFRRSTPVGSRLDEWRLGATALGDRPLLGFGPEGYRLVVDRYMSADYVRSYGDVVLPDRAHNAVIDVALSSGVFAALAYVGLLAIVVAASVRLVRVGTAAHVGVGAASIAFVVQQQFLFPIAEIDAVFWVVAGATVAATRGVGRHARPAERDTPITGGAPRGVRVPIAAGLAILAVGVTVSGVRSVAADRLTRSATEAGDVEQSINDAERAVDLDPHDLRHRLVLARSLEGRQTLNGVDAAIDVVEDARSISPHDPTVRRERARLASLRASITAMFGTLNDGRVPFMTIAADGTQSGVDLQGLLDTGAVASSSWAEYGTTTDTQWVGAVQTYGDPIAAEGGIDVAFGDVIVRQEDQRSMFTLLDAATRDPIDRALVSGDDNGNIEVRNDDGEIRVQFHIEDVYSALSPSTDEQPLATSSIITSADGTSFSVESVATLLELTDADVARVSRVASDGTTVIVTVTLTDRYPDETRKQLVLVGTPVG